MTLPSNLVDREFSKFLQTGSGETAVRVSVDGASSDFPTPTGPYQITVADVTDNAASPLVGPLDDRVSIAIRNLSTTDAMYLGTSAAVTADNTATGGWEIPADETFFMDIGESNAIFLVMAAGKTAKTKILEIASVSAGGGGVAGTNLQEQLIGVVDGVNVTFATTQLPLSAGSFTLFVNGIYQAPTSYSRSGQTITMGSPPAIGQQVDAVYVY